MRSYIKAFKQSFLLRNAYKVNTIIYAIERIPGVKKITKSSLYQFSIFKIIGTVISILLELSNIFIKKGLYIVFFIFVVSGQFKEIQAPAMLHISVFLTLIGLMFNTDLFNPSKDKFYATVLLKMDAKKYALSNYAYFLLKILIGETAILLLISLITDLSIIVIIGIPLFTIFTKVIYLVYLLHLFKRKNIIANENKPSTTNYILLVVLLGLAYGLPFINIVIPLSLFYLLLAISFIGFLFSIKYLLSFEEYTHIYKKLLSTDNVILNTKEFSRNTSKETYLSQIEYQDFTSDKKGYTYFNELFVKRHHKILMRSSINTAIVSFVIVIAVIIGILLSKDISKMVNDALITVLPYFMFIMYIINKGQAITQAMFMNCDHSMLTYRFYKEGKAILFLFTERLKTTIKINMIPTIVISLGLPILLYISGGTDNYFNYILLFSSIVSMSLFFTVHHLILYYLLQPYNLESETKSVMYNIISTGTYMVVYFFINVKLPTIIFGSVVVIFAITYILIALFLAYKYAPKTFKLR